MLASVRNLYGDFPQGMVISNGSDPSRFHPGEKEPFIMWAGRLWDQAKNIAALDSIAPRLEWPVYAAGSEVCNGSSSPLRRNIIMLGNLSPSELADRLSRASIFSLPAFYEPFGLSILEAGLSGCALVLGDIPSMRELWDGSALFVAPGDTDALADTLTGLIRDERRRTELASRSLQRAKRYSLNSMREGYLAVYDKLVERTKHVEVHG